VKSPTPSAAKAEQAHAISVPQGRGLPIIDEGDASLLRVLLVLPVRRLPDIKAAFDAERALSAQAPVDAGICEVAEAEGVTAP
jgi:hypothetical protein